MNIKQSLDGAMLLNIQRRGKCYWEFFWFTSTFL